jgi:alpha-galactosidase
MCEWGINEPWEWASNVCHSWRTAHDVGPVFLPIETSYDENGGVIWKPQSVLEVIEINAPLRKYAGAGHWNDPGMLMVGNSITVNGVNYDMTESEDRAHFTMWCMMASPLILGNDLTNMSEETMAIIKNKDLIAIDQDSLGIQGLRLKSVDSLQYWFKPLVNGDWAFCVMNTGEKDTVVTLDWSTLEVFDEISGRRTSFGAVNYSVRDLWDGGEPFNTLVRGKGFLKEQYVINTVNVTVKSHDVIAYRLTPVEKE